MIIGKQIYAVIDDDPSSVRSPYTIDYNRRPAIVAIYISLIDPQNAPKEYPKSVALASAIAECKSAGPRLNDASVSLVHMLNILTREWYRHNKRNTRVNLDSKTRTHIQLFADTLTRAAQMYRETLERNRILWDINEPGYIGEICAREFNLAFDIHYIDLAVNELHPKNLQLSTTTRLANDDDYTNLPGLIYDTPK